ncbi:MAG TPA: hypothetical protein VF996_03180 [Candidatus Saccharimonadales bacterium]
MPLLIFEVKGSGFKLVRDGIFKKMISENCRPQTVEIDSPELVCEIIRQKMQEELNELRSAKTYEEQIIEAGDFLAAADLLVLKNIDISQQDSEVIGDFQAFMHTQRISFNAAEIARMLKAQADGEYDEFNVVSAVTLDADNQLVDKYRKNEQWSMRRSYY